MKKRIIPLLVISALLLGLLSACTGKENNNQGSGTGGGATPCGNGQTSSGVSDWGYNLSGVQCPTGLEFGGGTGQTDFTPITLTSYEEDLRPLVVETNFQGEFMRQATADTGVTLKSQYGVGDVSEQITLMIADQSYPDFVFSRSNLSKFLEADAFIDLAPLIDQYGPNIKKLYGESFDSHKDEQGRIFYLGQNFVRTLPLDPENAFWLQFAVLEDQGYPEIRTLDQFAEAMRQYKAKYPEINGQPTIGLTLTCGDGWRWFISLGNPGGAATGIENDGQYYVNAATMQATWRFLLPEHREYYRWLNGLYNEGLLDPDAFTQTHDEYLQKIASGRVLGLTDAEWHVTESRNVLVGNGQPERDYGRFPVTSSKDVKHPNYREEPYMATNGVGITDNCTDPVRAIQFLDYLAREEIQIMTNWGFEGVHWEIRDGTRKRTTDAQQRVDSNPDKWVTDTGAGLLSYPWPCYGTGGFDENGYPIMPINEDAIKADYTETTKNALSAYGVEMWRDLFPQADELSFPPWGAAWKIADSVDPSSELGQIQGRCNDLTAEYLMRCVAAKSSDFDALWDEYRQKLIDAGADRAGELMTELVKKASEWYTG